MQIATNNIDSLLNKLSASDLLAVEMKFDGYNYNEIASKTGVVEGTVRQWFTKNGRLAEYYYLYAKEQAEIRKSEAHDTFKAHLKTAVRTLVDVMIHSKIDIARIQASKEIINRQLGEPLKVVANLDDVRVNEYLAAAKKISNENIQGNDGRGESPSVPQS